MERNYLLSSLREGAVAIRRLGEFDVFSINTNSFRQQFRQRLTVATSLAEGGLFGLRQTNQKPSPLRGQPQAAPSFAVRCFAKHRGAELSRGGRGLKHCKTRPLQSLSATASPKGKPILVFASYGAPPRVLPPSRHPRAQRRIPMDEFLIVGGLRYSQRKPIKSIELRRALSPIFSR